MREPSSVGWNDYLSVSHHVDYHCDSAGWSSQGRPLGPHGVEGIIFASCARTTVSQHLVSIHCIGGSEFDDSSI
jgi:hypothetical protein